MYINSAFVTLCLAAGSLARTIRTIEKGTATHWYPTGQPGPCPHSESDPSLTVAISPVFNVTTLCGTWVNIKNPQRTDITPLSVTVTTTCTTCGESDLSLGMENYYYLSDSNVTNEPASINVEWNFCDVGGKQC